MTTRLGRSVGRMADEDRRVATLLGLATVPITVALSWSAVTDPSVVLGGSISGGPLVLAGLIAGYYYSDRPTSSRQAGLQVGLVGSLATVVVYLANTATTVDSEPGWLGGVSVLLTPVAIGIASGLPPWSVPSARWQATGCTRRWLENVETGQRGSGDAWRRRSPLGQLLSRSTQSAIARSRAVTYSARS
ncbi:hypothetical protein C479_08868 [Halovivax asiaticus JCM 14624]|uniref:Uncharacterized protein n=1 Tax=Halovivax asiaticus JCM 14624 TaxID=1227490 RepID=M0BJ40_9EURY|nr:hypothetical protein C479_08868 [Halovivax asiaticus JCM 14624]